MSYLRRGIDEIASLDVGECEGGAYASQWDVVITGLCWLGCAILGTAADGLGGLAGRLACGAVRETARV